jgi:hypothetical protein
MLVAIAWLLCIVLNDMVFRLKKSHSPFHQLVKAVAFVYEKILICWMLVAPIQEER